ncbi:MAG: TrkH family potassium uptake protein [Lachnospiraceae bacterium]|nr:TrkH family potassium uptake protein [Lachnospiraceae bacterium]
MNAGMILYLLGKILELTGGMMALPFIVGLIYHERSGMYFLVCGAVILATGFLLTHFTKPKNTSFYARDGFVVTALSWLLLSLAGSLPLFLSGEIPAFEDALFECISGFTTTGASVVPAVEELSRCVNFWRCFIQLIGGMGVLVFMLALLPSTGGQDLYLMKAESPGPSVSKLAPKVRQTAYYLYIIYFVLTAAEAVCLVIAGAPLYDSICTAFTTTSTGGFGVRNDSLGSYGPAVQYVISVFLFLSGFNYNFFFCIWMKKFRDAFGSEEIRTYTGIFAVATLFIAVKLLADGVYGGEESFRHAFLQVGSIMTTAGYSSADFDQWPAFCREILIFMMLIGGCAGSTCGGIKISRVLIYLKTVGKEVSQLCHPRSVKVLKMEGKAIPHSVLRSANIFLITYSCLFALSMLLISLDGHDFTTNFTAVASAMGNIGPGFSLVGPTHNFAFFSAPAKYVLMFDMLAGRLELFPLLVLLSPATWRRN